MKKLLQITLVIVLPLTSSFAQAELYSHSDLKQLKKVETKDSCLAFEATFSKPLQGSPSAIVDIDKQDVVEGIISGVLEVISLSPQKYQLTVKDKDICEKMKGSASNVAVTIVDAKGSDGRPMIPSGHAFDISR